MEGINKINNMTSSNIQTNNNNQVPKYKSNLEDRTLEFSKRLLFFCKNLPKNNIDNPLINQVIRSGTSIGANYREANDRLGKKDFVNRLRIARKEAKETSYWLELIKTSNNSKEIEWLIQETIELRNILSAIISKSIEK
jgi:four helix bundle protein